MLVGAFFACTLKDAFGLMLTHVLHQIYTNRLDRKVNSMDTAKAQTTTASEGKSEYGSKTNPLSARDALALAMHELHRLDDALTDLSVLNHELLCNVCADDAQDAFAATLRLTNRILGAEVDECVNVANKVQYTIWDLNRTQADN